MAEGTDSSSNRKEVMMVAIDEDGTVWEWDMEFTGCDTLEEIKNWIKSDTQSKKDL